MHRTVILACLLSTCAAAAPTTQFVTVEEGVRLEVLDWGGSGRPMVLLAGLGDTAHVFDDFAPKLTDRYHVYGITRRGFGASSSAETGYSADRLGDDVLSVIDQLHIVRPVLVGHSIAGEELSSIGSRHPEKEAGLVYLDAAYAYAYYDGSRGDLRTDTTSLRHQLDELRSVSSPEQEIRLIDGLLGSELPEVEKDLRRERQEQVEALTLPFYPDPKPSAADEVSFAAFTAWEARALGVPSFPESEIRQMLTGGPDGRVGKVRTKPDVSVEIMAGVQKYTTIHGPVLAIFAVPKNRPAWMVMDDATRKAFDARDERTIGAQADAFAKGVPGAKVVRIPHASHYVFLSNEADVLSEIDRFVAGLN